MNLADVTPVILAGGRGVRLWPLTSKRLPKPFLKFGGEYSLLQQTALRCAGMSAPVVVCGADHAPRALRELRAVGVEPALIIAEPAGRSTAPAILAAALRIQGSMVVMPSDHMIDAASVFQQAVRFAAAHEGLVSLGAERESESRRYGHILYEASGAICRVRRFVEKPSKAQLRGLLKEGRLVWNTGIFACDAQMLSARMQALQPQIYGAVFEALAGVHLDGPLIFPEKLAYLNAPSISIDYAVLEKSEDGFVLPVRMGWRDIGCWPAVFGLFLEKRTLKKVS